MRALPLLFVTAIWPLLLSCASTKNADEVRFYPPERVVVLLVSRDPGGRGVVEFRTRGDILENCPGVRLERAADTLRLFFVRAGPLERSEAAAAVDLAARRIGPRRRLELDLAGVRRIVVADGAGSERVVFEDGRLVL